MAQYGKNLYGASYFGVSTAYSGSCTTDIYSTGKPLNGSISIVAHALLQEVVYSNTSPEFVYEGQWNNGETSSYESRLAVSLAARDIYINYNSDVGNDIALVTINRIVDGQVVSTTSVEVDMTTGSSVNLTPDTIYSEYQIEITKNTNDESPINIQSISGVVSDVRLQLRAGVSDGDNITWDEWEDIEPQYTTSDWTIVGGVSSDLSGKDRIQGKLILATSDDTTTPEVRYMLFQTGSSLNHVDQGQIEITVRFGSDFKEYDTIDWDSTEPEGTRVSIQTRTSSNGIGYSMLSAPYIKRDIVVLRENMIDGHIVSYEIDPENLTKWLTYQTIDWSGTTNNNIYENPDTNMFVRYEILEYIDGTWKAAHTDFKYSPSITDHPMTKFAKELTRKIKVKAILHRRSATYSTPYASLFTTKSLSTYSETKNVPCTISAVDNTTGVKRITSIADLGFSIPAVLQSQISNSVSLPPRYTYINNSGKPYINTYWKSLEGLEMRPNYTDSSLDELWVKCLEDISNPKYYQYGASSSIYPLVNRVPIYNFFRPSLDPDKSYKYALEMGWDNPGFGIDPDSNRNNEGRVIDIYWESQSTGDDLPLGDPTTWNMTTSNPKDKICSKVYATGIEVTTPWTSEHIIFDDGIVSANNNFRKTGVLLPTIEPGVVCSEHPYSVEVVDKSVKCHGLSVASDRIQVDTVDVVWGEFNEVKREITKGDAGGKDLLPHHNIIEILGIYDGVNDTMSDYLEDIDYTFDSTTSKIDWSLDGGVPAAMEPVTGSKYYVSYRYRAPKYADVVFKTDYTEPITRRSLWVADEIITREGVATPNNPMIDTNLPYLRRVGDTWDIDPNLEIMFPSAYDINGDLKFDPSTFTYTVDDNNLWVKTYVEKPNDFQIVGTLRDKKPKDNWLPQIHSGYYYIGTQKYYYYADPQIIELDDEHMPLANNITYAEGKFGQGVQISDPDSIITYPRDINFGSSGTVSFWFKPLTALDNTFTSLVFFEIYDDENNYMTLRYNAGIMELLLLQDGNSYSITDTRDFSTNFHHVLFSWNQSNLVLCINADLNYTDISGVNFDCKSFSIGKSRHNLGDVCNAIVDELIVFNYMVELEKMVELYWQDESSTFDPSTMNMKCSFEGNINETFDGSYVVINPVPTQRAPLIIQDVDGNPLRKVSFSDPITGEFITYNTEMVPLKNNEITVSYSNLEVDNFRTLVYNDKDIVGEPYTISGNKITLTLTDEESTILQGRNLKVVYQPKNCYVWDSNGPSKNSAYIRLGQNPGTPLTILYEKNALNYSLANTAELNPLLNPNHEGFMYVTSDPGTLSHIQVNISPDHLITNGHDMATIVIDTLDELGNPINNVDLEVTVSMGDIIKYSPNLTVSTRDESSYSTHSLSGIAGRHIYLYTVPYKTRLQLSEPTDVQVSIVDNVSGIGVESLINLRAIEDYGL